MCSTPSSSAPSTTANVSSRARCAGGEDQPVARDRAEHRARLRQQLAVRRRSRAPARSRARARAARAGGSPTAAPCRRASARVRPAVSAGESTVGIQTMRAPSRAAISTASGFIPPTAWFSVERPDHLDARDDAGDDLRALGRRGVVRLEREAGEPELGEAAGERDVVDPPRRHVGRDVDVQVVRALDEHARAIARPGPPRPAGSPWRDLIFASGRELREQRGARGRDPRLDAELEQQLARGLHLVHAPRRVLAAALDAGARAAARRSPRRSAARATPGVPGGLGGREALERRGGEALHEDRAQELQRRRVAGAGRRRPRPASRAARAPRRRRCAPGPEASAGVRRPRRGHRPEQRHVGEPRSRRAPRARA